MEIGEKLGRDAAARFVADRYGGRAQDVAELGAGDWSRAFSFRLDGRDLVVRFGRHLEDFIKDRMAMDFARPDMPVPAVLEIGEAQGGYYAVSERRFGAFLEALDECGWRSVLPAILRGLDALREVEPPGRGADWADEGSTLTWRQWLIRSIEDHPGERVSGWRARLRQIPRIEDVFVSGKRAMHSLLPSCPELHHVIHRDLINRNVLVSEDGTRLEAVFDWGCSVAGDFLYEIAWLTYWSPWYPALKAIDVRRAVRDHYMSIGLVVENFEERIACYEVQIGLEHIAYAAFTGREEDMSAVTSRTIEVLDRLAFA